MPEPDAPLTLDSRIADLYARPLGRDVVDKVLLQLGRGRAWVTNSAVSRLRLRTLARLARPVVGTGFLEVVIDLVNACPPAPPVDTGPTEPTWWKEAVFYQVYPRSFADADGDGVGDLRGIIDRLDHLAGLGVDCLWLSPIFASPGADNGYDVSDYRAIDPQMGSLADADELIAACHDRGMRIILDLVVNHTSDQHPWFQEARRDPDGPYGAYYFLREGSPDAPPNNWTSFFSGPAWRWLEGAQRWALRLFAPEQPDLDWDNPAVRAEVADIVQWWRARGVDGFRLDVINYISKAPQLPQGNTFVGKLMGFTGVEHYFHGPRLHDHLAELRRTGFTDQTDPDDVGVMIGETPGVGVEVGRLLTNQDRGELDLVFNFDHLEAPGKQRFDDYQYDLNDLKAHYLDVQSRLGSREWMSIFWDNHDNPRMVSKVDPEGSHRAGVAKALATIQLMMRGTPFLYQGQEIGAANQAFSGPADLRDVESLNRLAERATAGVDGWVEVMAGSRDHARTPMRWDASASHGFTTGTPWIGFHESGTGWSVAEQQADPGSVLSWTRDLIALRREHRALRLGSISFVDTHVRDYFAWWREWQGERWFIEINLRPRPLPRRQRDLDLDVVHGTAADRRGPMQAYEALVCRER
ncbi:alpha-glucosidase [Parenemella sanctibonifatiensis]|uniref:Glucohydrolase n=1 Tax=Parenemella sanctibonifatiensis TaxID=2016505 RepID=A0A255E8D8_9ACTN|nr:alpha-glucosidase [Parenemella sanctibonifatiensis]OYN87776.1 glucohydrolase [Parenemella sanctibonifatiensis]